VTLLQLLLGELLQHSLLRIGLFAWTGCCMVRSSCHSSIRAWVTLLCWLCQGQLQGWWWSVSKLAGSVANGQHWQDVCSCQHICKAAPSLLSIAHSVHTPVCVVHCHQANRAYVLSLSCAAAGFRVVALRKGAQVVSVATLRCVAGQAVWQQDT
jgi:hypothetical protein